MAFPYIRKAINQSLIVEPLFIVYLVYCLCIHAGVYFLPFYPNIAVFAVLLVILFYHFVWLLVRHNKIKAEWEFLTIKWKGMPAKRLDKGIKSMYLPFWCYGIAFLAFGSYWREYLAHDILKDLEEIDFSMILSIFYVLFMMNSLLSMMDLVSLRNALDDWEDEQRGA